MIKTLIVDDLELAVQWSERRKTLGLTIDRGGELIVSAPPGTNPEILKAFVREKKFWLYTKLAEKEVSRPAVQTRELVSGEGFPYLGRWYRLLLVKDQEVPLKLMGGRFCLLRAATNAGRSHFIDWYTKHAHPWLEHRLERYADRMGVRPARIEVRDLGFRWGSCGKGGGLNFHWSTILLPPSMIDYIIVHELAHIHEPWHTPDFWLRVERAMPDYEVRKRWLAENGGRLVTL